MEDVARASCAPRVREERPGRRYRGPGPGRAPQYSGLNLMQLVGSGMMCAITAFIRNTSIGQVKRWAGIGRDSSLAGDEFPIWAGFGTVLGG